ncbi:MAG: hypothetical protein AB7E47_02810 [Desulfovibrionaceae bacterium]
MAKTKTQPAASQKNDTATRSYIARAITRVDGKSYAPGEPLELTPRKARYLVMSGQIVEA